MLPLDEKNSPQTLAEFSPDGTKVAYIVNNNIFIKNLLDGAITQVTNDGAKNKIINGTTDWVYEEEFSFTKGFYWSPDSKKIAFLKFDESEVKTYELKYFSELYPEIYRYKYPKAGEDNSKVSLHLYQLENQTTQAIDLGEYEYIPRLSYSPVDDKLLVITLNRHQNELKYHLIDCSGSTPNSSVFYIETSDTYLEVDDNLMFLEDGKSILRTSGKSGYMHIYQLDFDGKQKQITDGNWDVVQLKGINPEKQLVYYISAENGASQKDLYVVSLKTGKKQRLSTQSGTTDAQFSEGMKYYIQVWSNANTPEVYTLHKASGKEIFVLEDNSELKKTMEAYNFSTKEFFTIQGKDTMLNAWMIKPPNFDPTKKYPVYMNVYGGPGHNMVSDDWDGSNYMYHQLLAQKGYIVIAVDPRGTMYRGEQFKKSTYLQLGKLELEDFVAVANRLKQRTYVDSSRIGIQGWSYGGYMTLLSMTKGAPTFKMGIAVAPVTNWRYYDNIYTERFMRTPKENEDGYDNNSPLNFADKLNGNLLLIQGTGDDNVHPQNSMEMVMALIANNKKFEQFFFPNKNHGIYGGNTREYLFNLITDYTLKNL
jgi:dipeptidyl-peptidase-4